MGAFDDAIQKVQSGITEDASPLVSWIIDTAEVKRAMLESIYYGTKPSLGTAANTDDQAPTYIEKLKTLTVSGWSKSPDGKTYSKSFVEDRQRDAAIDLLQFISMTIDDSVDFKSTKENIAGTPLMGTSTTQYKLTIPAAILEPILSQEGQLGGPSNRRSA